jgi:hypothetical protein
LCVRGPPECLILQVHRKPLQPWRDRDRRPEDCRESISRARLSPLSPCATRRNRGNQAPLRFRGGGCVRSRKEIARILRPGCLFESLAQGSGQPFRGELRPARSDRPPSALISRIRSRQDSVRRAADLGRKAMTSPPSIRPWDSPKAQKHTRIGFSLWAIADPVAAGPAMRPGSFHEGGGRRVQD